MEIDIALVRRLIDHQFPQWRRLSICRIEPGGWDNRTFRLGADLTVRLPSQAAYAAQVAKEQQWLPQLAAHLPVAIPMPVAEGLPTDEYPWHWSVYRWIDGKNAQVGWISDHQVFAADLAYFLTALQRTDATGGPPPGPHNFYRGGDIAVYDGETRQAIQNIDGWIDTASATAVWEAALQRTWDDAPVWVHGDIHPTNLLVRGGHLKAVIDFGCLAIGDPACDLAIAWTFFSGPSRELFRRHFAVDEGTWARAQGWAMWKALIMLDKSAADVSKREEARRVIYEVIAEFRPR